jgi:hypothetical protein
MKTENATIQGPNNETIQRNVPCKSPTSGRPTCRQHRGRRMEENIATGYLHYTVENTEDTINIETYDRALNEVAVEFCGEIEGTAFDPQTNTRTVRLTFNDVQTLEKFKTEVIANPPKLCRLGTPTHSEKVSKLKRRLDTFVGRTVKQVRVGTFKELNVFPEVLWWHDALDANDRDSEVWAHVTFTDGLSISFEASSIGFPLNPGSSLGDCPQCGGE